MPLPAAPWPGTRVGLEPLRCGWAFVPREESCVRREQLLLGPGVQAEAQLPAVGCCAAWPPKCVGREKNDGGLCAFVPQLLSARHGALPEEEQDASASFLSFSFFLNSKELVCQE